MRFGYLTFSVHESTTFYDDYYKNVSKTREITFTINILYLYTIIICKYKRDLHVFDIGRFKFFVRISSVFDIMYKKLFYIIQRVFRIDEIFTIIIYIYTYIDMYNKE